MSASVLMAKETLFKVQLLQLLIIVPVCLNGELYRQTNADVVSHR